ncbi:MAG TPA: S8 family serine peptidase [Thermoanaerobaculia bacterium]
MPRALAVLLLLAVTSSAQSQNVDVRLEPLPRGTFIVELQRAPGVAAAATLERFRRDVRSTFPKRGLQSLSAETAIRHEYTRALLAVAIDVPAESADAIRRLPYVRAVHPDRAVTAYATRAATTAAAIDAAARVNAGSLGTRGEGMRIGVIDSGIDYTHPALGGFFGPGHKVAGGYDFANDDADPIDDAGHGTHVAGIIAADSPEIAGVAPAATLFAYKVLDYRGSGFQSDVIAAIERSIDPNQDGNPADHLDVINISLGGPGNADDLVSRAADAAAAAGVIVVAAAGNAGVNGSIGSPGTARSAITVGAVTSSETVAAFSSRGPAAGLLGFKPDVVAPGAGIVSTWLGGVTATFDGTSMAAPHVAGAAALLRKLHPSWTPAEIKSALVTTTARVNDAPLGRAAGRIDAARADAATTFVDGAGVSFGLASAKSGMWEAVRTVSVTNRAAVARTYEIAPANAFPGATLTATPATLQLAPGETKSVELRLVLDASSPFPGQPLVDGDIEFRGDAPFALPWFFVRAARITVAYDKPAMAVVALSATEARTPFLYDVGKAEIFTQPDTQWDIMLLAYDPDATPSAMRLAWAENRVASGDSVAVLRSADTTAEVGFEARDKFNTLLSESPSIKRFRVLRLLYGKRPGLLVTVNLPDGVPDLFSSLVSSAFTLYFFEGFFDVQHGRAYNVQHEPLAGVAGSKTLSAGPASYKRMSARFPTPKFGPNAVWSCLTTGVETSTGRLGGLSDCSPVELGPSMVVEYFTTAESAQGVSGIDFDAGTTALGMLRGINGGILSCSWTNPSAVAYRISDGEEITLGTSPLYAFSFFGTAPHRYIGHPPGFTGPLGEWYRYTTADTPWVSYDAAGVQVAAGTYSNLTTCDEGPCDPGPAREPGGRYVAGRDTMEVAGHASRGEVEVRFGSDRADLEAPTLTALRVLNAQGRLTERLERNGNASLFFAAGDYHYPPAEQRNAMGSTRDLKREATRVSFRAHGTATWIPLTPVHLGSDLGVVLDLRRFPAGEMYRADLSAVTRAGADAVDLRIEIEDTAGNRTTWTQSPAIIVSGDGTPPPPRKRRPSRP